MKHTYSLLLLFFLLPTFQHLSSSLKYTYSSLFSSPPLPPVTIYPDTTETHVSLLSPPICSLECVETPSFIFLFQRSLFTSLSLILSLNHSILLPLVLLLLLPPLSVRPLSSSMPFLICSPFPYFLYLFYLLFPTLFLLFLLYINMHSNCFESTRVNGHTCIYK